MNKPIQKELKHKNLLLGLHAGLSEAIEENKYADKVLERLLRVNKKWGGKDRGFVSEAFYDIIRWKKLYEFYTERPFEQEYLYHYIVAYLLKNKFDFLKWSEFEGVSFTKLKNNLKKTPTDKAVLHSIPNWLKERLDKELPAWEKEMYHLNQKAPVVLRVNTLKTNREALIEALLEDRTETKAIAKYPDALVLEFKKNVFRTPSFQKGFFEIQDASSQKVVEVLDVKPGQRVIDVCAGAGGKTLHLAAKMENKGQIIALDIFEWKLAELKKRAKRAGAHNIQTKAITDTKVIKRLEASADRLLIDAPCSGLGVLKRNPDSKWKLSNERIDNLIKTQKEILDDYCKLLKVNGIMVYATCSILPSENQDQVRTFLENHPNFKLLSEEIILPSASGFDGFYISKLERIS